MLRRWVSRVARAQTPGQAKLALEQIVGVAWRAARAVAEATLAEEPAPEAEPEEDTACPV